MARFDRNHWHHYSEIPKSQLVVNKLNEFIIHMKTAYLYVRVSTDEQKKKGYSLPEQEDRLLKYCHYNSIKVLGIYREDYSAKDFNRPEWKKLLAIVKQKPREDKNILFIKW